ncbi:MULTISPECIES: archaetidylserine decarboxylase [Methylomonas]|uniref:Phosphatidylserine decarboxylase proenzyme n=2 Tax=Methylomonas TaxID=416 RepID=A0A126T0X0_9GAMM|nr:MULTISPECIES: archaetidylserine decarboxylase [Methylomonas]AMK75732.1 phosphatidylserine decarboxylase [Methylomonas denitrificans]OAH98274.1 phosphatidylserine decarboxylase [Methylomonas methanica]TCV82441.1 phosphatidylserine decarboxylase [Methylomonas methanica]
MNLKEIVTVLPQYALPHHALSGLMSKLTHCQNKTWKNLFIKSIVSLYGVNMSEAKFQNLDHYASFNKFFTRELRDGVRPLAAAADAIACPADGAVSQAGPINDGRIFQAKGHDYTALELLGGDTERAQAFANGSFATIYLSPKDYHRLHMPLTGTLREMVHIPGRLFSVNNTTVGAVPNLFARNERVACIFDTEAGPMALILVGAIFVSSVETVWHGVVTPPSINEPRTWRYEDNAPVLEKGTEMGRFNMGSTIIVLFGKDKTTWNDDLTAGKAVQLGEAIGRTLA